MLLTIVFKKGAILDATGCDAGLTLLDGDGITVKNATIVGAARGIVVKPGAARVTITKSTIRNADPPALPTLQDGIAVEGAAAVVVEKTTIRGAAARGVHVASAADTIIRKSTIADGAGDGVAVDLGERVAITKNALTNLGGSGVRFFHDGLGALAGAVDSVVASNTIIGTAGGLAIGGTGNLIEKNKILDTALVSIHARAGSGSSIYRKNTITRAANAAILAEASLDTFEKNTVKDPLAVGVDVVGSDNAFVGGKVTAPIGDGWLVRPGANGNRFEGVSSAKAGGDGFDVRGLGNTFLKAKASGSTGLDLNDAAGGGTTNTYTSCKFKTSTIP